MLAFGLIVNAQDNLNFTILSNSIFANGQNLNIESAISKTGNTLNWTQTHEDGSEQISFSIVSSSGAWDQSTSIGELTYQLDIDGTQVILVLTGTNSTFSAKLTYILSNSQQQEYSFSNNEINYQ